MRVFVLGPPEGKSLKYTEPDQGEGYLCGGSLSLDACYGMAVADPAQFAESMAEAAQPFDDFYEFPYEDVRKHVQNEGPAASGYSNASRIMSFFEEFYGFDAARKDSYRRIDHDWLGLAEGLALAEVSYVNNTSLALAFELGERGPVLLFPGDAQAGSWLTLPGLSWEVPTPGGRCTVTEADLLGRVIFYKVGHHGSHNATMKEKGLEMMGGTELVAFIPVHRATALAKRPP